MIPLASAIRQGVLSSSRIDWRVSPHGPPFKQMAPPVLLEKIGALASALVADAVNETLVLSEIESLEVLAAVKAGDRLVATAALEPLRHGRHTVSVVVRKNEEKVVVAGELVFIRADEQPAKQRTARLAALSGKSPIETTFHARTRGQDWLLDGNPLEWVHASALLSAQGHAGRRVRFIGVQALSRLGPVRHGELLVLHCSVVRIEGDLVTVLSQGHTERNGRGILTALSIFST